MEFKNKILNFWKWLKISYVLVVTLLCILWCPFVKLETIENVTIVQIDFMDYHKTITITK